MKYKGIIINLIKIIKIIKIIKNILILCRLKMTLSFNLSEVYYFNI